MYLYVDVHVCVVAGDTEREHAARSGDERHASRHDDARRAGAVQLPLLAASARHACAHDCDVTSLLFIGDTCSLLMYNLFIFDSPPRLAFCC